MSESDTTQSCSMSVQLAAPQNFSFKSEEWPAYLKRFNRFRLASGLSEKPQNVQVETLLYVMGTNADTIVENLKLSTDELSNFTTVQDKLSQLFLPKTYVIYEFNQRFER